jgi:hypothetical protein
MPQFYTPKGRSTYPNPLPSPTIRPIYNIPMKLVPLYDGNENLGSVPLATNLDTWDGEELMKNVLGNIWLRAGYGDGFHSILS